MPDTSPLSHVKRAQTELPVHAPILERWSPRSFNDKPVSAADLETLFTAASWAASSRNEQPWRFLVGRKDDETYKKLFDSLAPPNQGWAKSAPVLFASFGKKTFAHNGSPNPYSLHDTGASTATLALQATALGLHVHGMGGFDRDTLRAFFGVPTDFDPGAVWALGYAGDPDNVPNDFKQGEKEPRTRKSLDQVVFSDWETPASF